MKQTQDLPCKRIDVICQGAPKEMGLAQGTAAQGKIRAARDDALCRLEAFRLQQPRWLPFWAYRWLAEQRAWRFLAGPLTRDYPAMSQRLVGIAEGARVGLRAIYLFNALEPLLSSVGGCTACPGACSAVAVRGRRSANGEPMIAQNFDYLPLVQPYYLLRETRPQEMFRALEFTIAPLAGAVDGMNEKGLCITYNYAFTTDCPPGSAAPISMAISDALARCGTVTDAADAITSKPRSGGGLLMLADATGDVASLELSSTRAELRRPAPGEDVLFHANAFATARMREVQVAWDAVYTNRAPTPLRGRRVHQSSHLRNQRFELLLSGSAILGRDELGAIMADHGASGNPDDFSPCVHGTYWRTTACLQLFPKSRRMRVAYDTACCARFEEVEL
jgi:predicted choloylglycine hydrolase